MNLDDYLEAAEKQRGQHAPDTDGIADGTEVGRESVARKKVRLVNNIPLKNVVNLDDYLEQTDKKKKKKKKRRFKIKTKFLKGTKKKKPPQPDPEVDYQTRKIIIIIQNT